MQAYIISYFGDPTQNQQLVSDRKQIHRQQLEWLLSCPGITQVTVLSMEYQPLDYLDAQGLRYVDSPLVPPSQARNRLLEIFYQQGDTWALFADNDSILDARFDGPKIVDFLDHQPRIEADWITPVNPMHMPFTAWIQQNKHTIQHSMPFQKTTNCKGSLFFASNKGKEPIYFDPAMKSCEDIAIYPELLKHQRNVYCAKSVILKDLAHKKSTLFPEDKKTNAVRKTDIYHQLEYIYKKYQDLGCRFTAGKISYREMQKHQQPQMLWVLRENSTWGNGLFELDK